MKLILSPRAEKQLRKVSKVNQVILGEKIRSLKDSKRSIKEEQLKGYKRIFRVRVGDYRIVYRRSPEEIYVVLIAHRSEIYKLVDRLLR